MSATPVFTQPTTKTNNIFFSGTNTGNAVLAYSVNDLLLSVSSATLSIGFDGYHFMPLTQGNHSLQNVHIKTLYMSGTGTWSGWGLG